ncbi:MULTISPECIES: hypothetical protein [unclassified Sphingomonas]|uniref:hypothetical protein n=1 Tax=unclassified Sphingomonas TaxID=196159 RepID=UPI000BD91CD9|nr:MAG: hypothetical protein B7Y98_14235 [Sphingomonas sp. 32-62-10]
MSLTQLIISLVGVLGLALIARLLRLGEGKIASEDDACRIAEEMLAGFEARRAIVSKDGDAALVGGNGTVAVLKRHGAKVAARRLVPPLAIRDAPEGVTIDTGERLFGSVTLINVFPDDARALAAPLTLV